MICTQCEGEIPEGATECPHCGAVVVLAESAGSGPAVADILSTPAAPGGPAAAVPAAPSSGSAPAFKFDMERWSRADRIAGGATLVLFISLFLPWFSYRYIVGITYSWNGLVHGYMYITLLICLAIFAYLIAIAGYERLPFKLPVRHEAAILIATVVNLVLVFIGFIDKPYGVGVGWSFGSFVGLVAAIVAAAPLGIPVIQGARKGTK